MQYMPWYFWIGVFLLGLANGFAMLQFGGKVIRVLLLMVTMLFVWGTPCFVVLTVTGDAYWHASTFMRLIQIGRIDSSVALYLEWPGVFIIGSIFTLITAIKVSQFIQYYPLLNCLILIIGFYLLSKRLLKSDISAFISTTFMTMGQLFIQLHYSPYGTAFSIFPITIYLLISGDVKERFMGILFSFALVIIHAFVPIFLMLIVGVIPWIFSYFLSIPSKHHSIAILVLVYFVTWLMNVATMNFTSYVNLGIRIYNTWFNISRLEAIRESYFGYPYPEISYLRKGFFCPILINGFLRFTSRIKSGQK
jgi:hypothetical protein